MTHGIIKVHIKILFHFYKYHKNQMTEFRIWFVARHLLDKNGTGRADMKRIARLTGLQIQYVKRVCMKSKLFASTKNNDAYYVSLDKLMKRHGLYSKIGWVRGERLNTKYRKYFSNKKQFIGYITKCFFENDINPKFRNQTKGRIGSYKVAKCLRISRTTVLSNLQVSDARAGNNIREFRYIKFSSFRDYVNGWLLENMNTMIGGYRVKDNIKSYLLKRDYKNGGFYLTQTLPKIYKFTGIFLMCVTRARDKALKPSYKKQTYCAH